MWRGQNVCAICPVNLEYFGRERGPVDTLHQVADMNHAWSYVPSRTKLATNLRVLGMAYLSRYDRT